MPHVFTIPPQTFTNSPHRGESRARGSKKPPPIRPGARARVRDWIRLQPFLANLAGIGNSYGTGVSLPVPQTPTSELPWFAQASPSQPGWYGTTAGTASRDVHLHVNGQMYGSAADLARILKPELARIGSA
jgi:hypothetical protein